MGEPEGEMHVEITETKFRPVSMGPVRALATLVFDDAFVVRGIKIVEKPDGMLFVPRLRRPRPDGRYIEWALPMTPEFWSHVQAHVLTAYKAYLDSPTAVASEPPR
jgi:stage V sporulation protein G